LALHGAYHIAEAPIVEFLMPSVNPESVSKKVTKLFSEFGLLVINRPFLRKNPGNKASGDLLEIFKSFRVRIIGRI
jgi:hypothetical protein